MGLVVCAMAGAVVAGREAPRQAAPRLVQFDVSVIDAQGQPMRGLGPGDFEILADGRPAEIAGAAAVDLPPSPPPAAALVGSRALANSPLWTRTIVPDVIRNDTVVDRFIAVVIDDVAPGAGEGASSWAATAGIDIARGIVDRLGPDDRAAVFFASGGRQQAFTSDRAKLLEALDRFELASTPLQACGAASPGSCAAIALLRAADALPPARPSRTMIAFIPGALGVPSAAPSARPSSDDAAGRLLRTLDAANAAVYTFGPPAAAAAGGGDAAAFAAATGGRAIVDTMAVPAQVESMLADSRSFYRFAVSAAGDAGRYVPLTVQVKRPDVSVRVRPGYYVPDAAAAGDGPAGATPLERALVGGVPATEVPMGATIAAFGTPGRREAVVSIAANLTSRPDAGAAGWQAEVAATAFDRQWRPQASHRQTIEVTARPDGAPQTVEVLSALELLPGRYEVRLGAVSGGRAGSVFVEVDVPEFLTASLSASGVVVSSVPKPPAGLPLLADVLPVVPTTRRVFTKGESVEAFVRFYQGNRGRLRNMPVSLMVSNAAGEGIIQGDETILPSQFVESSRATDWRFLLPLDRLPPGEYLLTVEAAIDDDRVARHLRFGVAQ